MALEHISNFPRESGMFCNKETQKVRLVLRQFVGLNLDNRYL